MSGHKISIDVDLMRVETHGPLLATDSERMFLGLAEILRTHGAAYLLVDARGGISMDNDMRRQVIQQARTCSPTAIAVFGATVPQQAMMILVSSAVQILRTKRLPLRFASSELEAQAWLVDQRPAPR
jgi:hypothetical protein